MVNPIPGNEDFCVIYILAYLQFVDAIFQEIFNPFRLLATQSVEIIHTSDIYSVVNSLPTLVKVPSLVS